MFYDYSILKDFIQDVMKKAGLEQEEAEIFAESLLYSDCRGLHSHGISRLSTYAKRVKCGVITAGANVEIIKDAPSALKLDGHNGIGAKIAKQAMKLCIERAKKTGCCVATVNHANHFGAGAFYTKYASKQNMISIMLSNSEAAVAPTGGAKAMLGTNPLGIGVPAGRNDPFDLDMATSVVARGKVVLAQKEHRNIPLGWAVDKNGAPTTDPKIVLEGGYMLPFGGPKGYGISLFIDLMCSCLGGAKNCRTTSHFWTDFSHPQDVGYFIIVIDPTKFLPLSGFLSEIDKTFDEFKKCPTAPGVKSVLIPGEIEANYERISAIKGVSLSDAVINELRNVGHEYGVKVLF